jgi:hypothetical protein
MPVVNEPSEAPARAPDDARRHADESVARKFTRLMRASTSRYGVLTDPPVVCAMIAVLLVPAIVLYQLGLIDRGGLVFVYPVLALPVVVALAVNAAGRGARQRVVTWLASLPFPLENMNGLLNGVGYKLLVRFVGEPPPRVELNQALDAIHPDVFALEYASDVPEVEVHVGVLESKVNPAGANHRRYRRVHDIVERCFVPMHAERPIAWIRVS